MQTFPQAPQFASFAATCVHAPPQQATPAPSQTLLQDPQFIRSVARSVEQAPVPVISQIQLVSINPEQHCSGWPLKPWSPFGMQQSPSGFVVPEQHWSGVAAEP